MDRNHNPFKENPPLHPPPQSRSHLRSTLKPFKPTFSHLKSLSGPRLRLYPDLPRPASGLCGFTPYSSGLGVSNKSPRHSAFTSASPNPKSKIQNQTSLPPLTQPHNLYGCVTLIFTNNFPAPVATTFCLMKFAGVTPPPAETTGTSVHVTKFGLV